MNDEVRSGFDAIVVPHIDVLFRVARSITGSTHDAEDNPPSPSAEDVATHAMTEPWLAGALAHLGPRLRQVVELVDVHGLSYHDAAAALDVPSGTVMSRLHRARHQMRTFLERDPEFRRQHR